VSADSIVPGAGKPQALNRYSYVFNNPLKYVDPSGHVAATDDIDAGCTDSACRRPLIQLYALYGAKVDNGLLESVPGGEQWYTAHISEWDGTYGSYYNEHGERFDYQPSTGEHMALGYAQYSKTGDGSILKQFIGQAVAEAPAVYAGAVLASKAEGGGTAAFGQTLKPGPHAKKSIPARGPERDFTDAERTAIDQIGKKYGCHTCGTKKPGTKDEHFIPDHQPPID
jgi:hypothetical protein